MAALHHRMALRVNAFVQATSQEKGVVGILVFGSFVIGEVRETSDLDLLVLREDIAAPTRTMRRAAGVPLEVYQWPRRLLQNTLDGERGTAFSAAFLYAVLRRGRILYDPNDILAQSRNYVQTHQLPRSHVQSLARALHQGLSVTHHLLVRGELEGAEVELRKSVEYLARVMLLERNVVEINPPKIYVPWIRRTLPDVYPTFCDVQNLGTTERREVETALRLVTAWRERAAMEARRIPRAAALHKLIDDAQTELANAQDCVEAGDLVAAALQVRYATLYLLPVFLRRPRGTVDASPSEQLRALQQSRHPYGAVVTHVMQFTGDQRQLERQGSVVTRLAQRYE
jgi:predicted nucleotidyltransferase